MRNMIEIMIDELEDFRTVARLMKNTLFFKKKSHLDFHEIWYPVEQDGIMTIFTCMAQQSEIESMEEVGEFTVIDAEWRVRS